MAISAVASAGTIAAPYKNAAIFPLSFYSSSGCATGKITSPISWSSTTGVLQMSDKSTAASCKKVAGPIGGDNYAYAETSLSIGVPIKIATSTTHQVVVTWDISSLGSLSLAPGKCTGPTVANSTFWYCDRYAEWFAEADAYLFDVDNNTYYWAANGVAAFNESYNLTEKFGGTTWSNSSSDYHVGSSNLGNQTFWINTSALVASHHYVLVTLIDFITNAYVYAYQAVSSGAFAMGSVTMNGASDRATLVSIGVR